MRMPGSRAGAMGVPGSTCSREGVRGLPMRRTPAAGEARRTARDAPLVSKRQLAAGLVRSRRGTLLYKDRLDRRRLAGV